MQEFDAQKMKESNYSDFEPSFSRVLQVQDILVRYKLVAIKVSSNFSEMVNTEQSL